MAHVEKFGRAASGHMFKHYERAKDENGQYIKFSNQDIDATRTSLNYNLAPERDINQGEFIRQRCNEPDVHENKRKDLNVMVSWVLTLPKDLEPVDHRQFMEEAYKFMADRYGEKNVVSAYVHMDEVRPHIHFVFVPVIEDKKKGGYKVDAKNVVNRYDMQTFHADLDRHMERVYGRNIGILNEATREGNKSIEELKRSTAAEQLQQTKKELQAVKQEITESMEHYSQLQHNMEKLRDEVQQLWEERTTATQEASTAKLELQDTQNTLAPLQAQRDDLARQIEAYKAMCGAVTPVKEKKNMLTGKIVEVTMTKEVYDACVSAHSRADHAEYRAKDAEENLRIVKNSAGSQENIRLKKDLSEAKSEIDTLRRQGRDNSEQLEKIWSVFERKPEILEAVKVTLKQLSKENSETAEEIV